MNKAINQKRIKKLAGLFALLAMIMVLVTGCGKKNDRELYHRFSGKTWERFNLLSFEMPVENAGTYNIYLFAGFDPGFEFETLGFNMVMNTPSGEERINEYQMPVRSKTGNFCIECNKDSCSGLILLKKGIRIAKPGQLKIEIENLTPRLRTDGILGVGIRLTPAGK